MTLAIVEFAEGVRALGQLAAPEPRLGMRVKVAYGELSSKNGVATSGLRFDLA